MAETDARFEQMRAEKAPTPASTDELVEYVNSLVAGVHTYNTCVPAMSLAAVATFNFVASKLAVTGYQASCADIDILRRTRNFEAGIVINFENALYPQYDLHARLQEALDGAREWLAQQAREHLAKVGDNPEYPPHPSVIAHWRRPCGGRVMADTPWIKLNGERPDLPGYTFVYVRFAGETRSEAEAYRDGYGQSVDSIHGWTEAVEYRRKHPAPAPLGTLSAAPTPLEQLDRLGPVLCQLGHQRINLSVDRWADGRWYYFVDGKDAQGRFFSGMGETPSAALASAERFNEVRASGGVHVYA